MKNLKKLLAVIISVALMATMMVPAFAAETKLSDAQVCELLGMLKGSGAGITEEYLSSATERNQAAIMFLRLKGLEDEAKAFTGTDNFDDAEELGWAEGRAILAYLKAHPELGWQGVGDNKFEPRATIDAKSYYKVMLEALGYKQGVDFEWSEVLDFAAEIGLAKIADVEGLTNADVATATVEALLAKVKGEDITLIEKLVADGVISEDAAIEAGLVAEELAVEAKAVGAKKFQVSFSGAVDTSKATFAVKKGTISINTSKVEWNEDKTAATIELVSKITKGDYTITIGGVDLPEGANVVTVTADDEKVAEIEIPSDTAALVQGDNSKVRVNYVVRNQYGEDVTAAKAGELTWTYSQGNTAIDVPSTVGVKEIQYTTSGATFLLNSNFTVSILHPNTGTFATKVMKVGDFSRVAKIEPKSLYHRDNKTLFTNSTYTDFYVIVEAYDQYGNKVTDLNQLNNAGTTTNQTTVIITNPAVLAAGTFTTVPGTNYIGYQLAAPATPTAGTAVIHFYSNITGHQSTFTVEVAKPASLDSLILEAPADIVVVGEQVKIPFTALDQNGVPLSEKAIAALNVGDLTTPTNDVSITSSAGGTASFSYNYETQKAELTLNLAGAQKGISVIMAMTRSGKASQITIDIKDVAKPVAVVGVKDLTTLMTPGAAATIKASNINVVDQYGRIMKLDSNWFTKYKLQFTSSLEQYVAFPVTNPGGTPAVNEIDPTTGDEGSSLTLSGVAVGTSTIRVSIYDKDARNVINNSAYEFVAQTVAKSAVAEYKVEMPEVLYNNDTHAKAISVYGLTSGGSKVAIPATDYVVTANDEGVTYNVAVANKLSAGRVKFAEANKEKVVTVLTVISGSNGPVTLTNTVTVTNKAPVLTTIEAKTRAGVPVTIYASGNLATITASNLNGAGGIKNLAATLSGKDQYGVDMAIALGGDTSPRITNVLITNYPSSITVTNNGQSNATVTGAAAGDTFTVTFITDNSLTKILTVEVR